MSAVAKNKVEAALSKSSDSSGSMPVADLYGDEDDGSDESGESEAAGEETSEMKTLSGQAVLDAVDSKDASAVGRALWAAFKAFKALKR